MTRLIVFAISVVGLLSLLNLRAYKSEAVSNKKFNFKSAEQEWKDYQAKIHPVKKVKKVKSYGC